MRTLSSTLVAVLLTGGFGLAVGCDREPEPGPGKSRSEPVEEPRSPVEPESEPPPSPARGPKTQALAPPPQNVQPVAPAPGLDRVDELVHAQAADVIALRRKIHEHPELGERETATAAMVGEHLEALGLEVRTGVAKTGVVGILEGGKPGPVVAWRADMDALPIKEETGLTFASTREDEYEGQSVGVMHACGHDVHVSVAMGIASVLANPTVRAELPGKVMFIFQPAEEGVPGGGSHGAKLMLEEGLFRKPKPDAVFGFHVHPDFEVGEIAVRPGGIMAATDRFEILIKGKQAHGAYPQSSVDPVVAASQIVGALQTIASRNVDTRDTVVVTVGKVVAGNRYNIIPETALLVGTVRTHDGAVQDMVHRRLRDLVTDIASGFGATAEITIDKLTPITVNDPTLLSRMQGVLSSAVDGRIVQPRPNMVGEDFAFYGREAPALFYFLGVANQSRGITEALHTSRFNVDEGAIEVGLRAGTHLLLSYLHGG